MIQAKYEIFWLIFIKSLRFNEIEQDMLIFKHQISKINKQLKHNINSYQILTKKSPFNL